ncbi:MAG TPA: hypothetical protein VI861_03850, partial [Rickettsiales bacterium]|nr:hypothetical protein [Rickettsiales bacterium]
MAPKKKIVKKAESADGASKQIYVNPTKKTTLLNYFVRINDFILEKNDSEKAWKNLWKEIEKKLSPDEIKQLLIAKSRSQFPYNGKMVENGLSLIHIAMFSSNFFVVKKLLEKVRELGMDGNFVKTDKESLVAHEVSPFSVLVTNNHAEIDKIIECVELFFENEKTSFAPDDLGAIIISNNSQKKEWLEKIRPVFLRIFDKIGNAKE